MAMAYAIHLPATSQYNPSHANYKNQVACSNVYQHWYMDNLRFKLSGALKLPVFEPFQCRARRRMRYEAEDEDGFDDEDWGYNEEIAKLEMYSQSSRDEALLVTAMIDDQQVEVVIFKGFSSCLSYKTSPDPSKSILPQRARIKFIDRIRAPFNPANTEYIEKGLTWEAFQTRLSSG